MTLKHQQPPIILSGNTVYIQIDTTHEPEHITNKYIVCSISGYAITLLPLTYEEVMLRTKDKGIACKNFADMLTKYHER